MKKRISLILSLTLVVGLVFTVALVSGCAKAKKPAEKPAVLEPYKIGAIFSVTGPNAPLGEPEKLTAEMMVEQVNAAGGIKGHQVQLIVEDDAGDEQKAVMAAKKLIESDNVIAVIGPTLSGTSLKIMPLFEETRTPLISCAASIKIVEPIRPWVFKTPQSDRDAISKILDYLEKQGIEKIAFISVSVAFGESGRIEMENLAPQRDFEVVAKESFDPEDTDMTAQLNRIKGTDAQAVVCWGTSPGPAIVTLNMKQLKMKIPLIQSHGAADMKYIKLSKGAAEGVVLPAGRLVVADQIPDTDPQKKLLLEYKGEYEKKYGKPTNPFGGYAYDALKILFMALDKVGADKARIRDEIEDTKNFIGTGGIFNFSKTDHNGLTKDAFVMVKIENGAWKLLSF